MTPENEKKEPTQEEMEKFNRELNKRILRTLFPTLTTVPLPWLILGGICLLFSLFTCIL